MNPDEIPVSYLVLGTLPEYKFNVQSTSFDDSWESKAKKCLLDTLFEFIINGSLTFNLIEGEQKIFFNKILLKLARFEIRVNKNCESIGTSWLENRIEIVLLKHQFNELSDFLKDLFVCLLFEENKGEKVVYINPYKQFIARLVEEGVSEKVWSCRITRLNSKLFNDSKIIKIEMIIDDSNIKKINYHSRLFYTKKCDFIEKNNFYLLEKTLIKLIDNEFLRYKDAD